MEGVEAKVDVNWRDTTGEVALNLAARAGHEAVVKRLVEAKADVNLRNRHGEAALFVALTNINVASARLLRRGYR